MVKFAKAVYVLHAFQKKIQKTRDADIAIAARRFKQIDRWRGMKKERVVKSTGNVFVDLRFEPAEAQVLALRADLMAR